MGVVPERARKATRRARGGFELSKRASFATTVVVKRTSEPHPRGDALITSTGRACHDGHVLAFRSGKMKLSRGAHDTPTNQVNLGAVGPAWQGRVVVGGGGTAAKCCACLDCHLIWNPIQFGWIVNVRLNVCFAYERISTLSNIQRSPHAITHFC